MKIQQANMRVRGMGRVKHTCWYNGNLFLYKVVCVPIRFFRPKLGEASEWIFVGSNPAQIQAPEVVPAFYVFVGDMIR